MKKLIALLTTISVTLVLTGCSGLDSIIEKDAVSSDGIVTSDEMGNGLYILKADGTYMVPNTANQNFKGEATSASRDRLTWSVDGNKTIPVITAEDKLVYFSTGEIPEYFGVEQFAGGSYTFGLALLTPSTDGGVIVSESGILNGSSAETSLSGSVGRKMVLRIETINGEEIDGDTLSYSGSITGLNKGETYTIGAYIGTRYGETQITADTRVFSSYMTTTTAGYTLTKNGYAEIDISDLEDGFYSVDGQGLFEIRRTEKASK